MLDGGSRRNGGDCNCSLMRVCMIRQGRQAQCHRSNDMFGRRRVRVRAAAMCLCALETLQSGIDLATTMHVCHRDAVVRNECVVHWIGQLDCHVCVLEHTCILGHNMNAPCCRRCCDGPSVAVIISFSAQPLLCRCLAPKRRSPGNSISFIGFERQRFEGLRAL